MGSGSGLSCAISLNTSLTAEQRARVHLIDTLDEELIEALVGELEEASGGPVIPLSGVSGTGVDWVLDKLLEAIGPEAGAVAEDDEGEDAIEWSPL